eukprot:TRINITY_DN12618_c0_g1_i1.p1 TRINITY_DN12618_c0_g1~~TRINITY_DN12618_c0_g1_i1.p1  ORF type:complete len:454 (-),score=80.52 TRINITY_DN12618_c0_g1_i1:48-1409(-)
MHRTRESFVLALALALASLLALGALPQTAAVPIPNAHAGPLSPHPDSPLLAAVLKGLPTAEESRHIGQRAASQFLQKNGPLDKRALNPVFLMPGFLASALMSEFRKTTVPNIRCPRQEAFHQLWVNISNLNPLNQPLECVFDTLSTSFDPASGTYSYKPGVSVSPKDFGGLGGVEYLDPNNLVPMFGPLVAALEEIGYTRGVNLKGLPYEFVFPGYFHDKVGYFDRVARLIEDTYIANGRSKVVLVGHSMGTLMSYYFLLTRTQEWKDTYIKSHLAITPLYLGAALSVRLLVSGVSPSPVFQEISRDISRGWGSAHWFLPTPSYNNIDFVKNPSRTYNSTQFGELFRDLGIPEVSTSHQNTLAVTGRMASPGVPLYCYVAVGVPTPFQFEYSTTTMTEKPTVTYVDGDGLVTAESARSCSNLNPTSIKEYETNHLFIVYQDEPIQDMISAITA